MFSDLKLPQFQSKRMFELHFAQQKYNEIQCKLRERVSCVDLQIKNMRLLSNSYTTTDHNQENNNQQNSTIQSIQEQFQQIRKFISQQKYRTTQNLLKKQTFLQEQAQKYDITRQYQERIYEMGCNLYTKQVDISVDHIGKPEKQKPTLIKVRQFSRFKVQVQNIYNFMKKIQGLRAQINRLKKMHQRAQEKKLQLQIQIQKVQQQRNISKSQTAIQQKQTTQSAITKQSSSSSCEQNSNPQTRDQQPVQSKSKSKQTQTQISTQYQQSHPKRIKLLLSSQIQLYGKIKNEFDPQVEALYRKIAIQDKRQRDNMVEYNKAKILFRDLCMQNRDLAMQYRIRIRDRRAITSAECNKKQ